MGRTGLARTALATVALSVPAVGMIAVPAANAAIHVPPAPAKPPATLNSELASYAKTLEGVPYVLGGTTRAGLDCSGLTQFVYHHLGKAISRTADAQFREFRAISKAEARPGDLLFFHVSSDPNSYVYHVAVFEGGNFMVAASSGHGSVIWESYAWAGNTVTFGTITH
jgi:cell wall-associated NlpC family hydrolase